MINYCLMILCGCLPLCNSWTLDRFVLYEEANVLKLMSNANYNVDNWLAEVAYNNDINGTGFAYLEVKSNSDYPDEQQAYYAGYAEGAVTSSLIFSQWYNSVKYFCQDIQKQCSKINNFLKQNRNYINREIKANKYNSYWHQVNLYYKQISGILDGFNSQSATPKLTDMDMLWLSFNADILDLNDAFSVNHTTGEGHCSVLIKLLPGNKDIYFGHNTWTTYQNMLRFQKKYILNFKKSPGSKELIAGSEMTFTGFPGAISSMDDFYLISSGLAATETTNEIFNTSLWQYIRTDSVLENVRSMVANRLANDGQTWNELFKLHNSGTYNNQWMIVDYKKFKRGLPPTAGTFWVSEQIPSKIVANDLTAVLIEKGYWSSYNIPYYKEIYDISGYNVQYEKYGNWFSHSDAPRAQIFRRDQGNVTDMCSFMDVMRSNDYTNDPAARCQCNPPYSATGAIAARNDLNPANGTYQYKGQGHRPSGAIDAKITNSRLFINLQFVAVSGPTTGTDGNLPPFDWSKSGFVQTPHLSHPNIWNFKPVLHKWILS